MKLRCNTSPSRGRKQPNESSLILNRLGVLFFDEGLIVVRAGDAVLTYRYVTLKLVTPHSFMSRLVLFLLDQIPTLCNKAGSTVYRLATFISWYLLMEAGERPEPKEDVCVEAILMI